MFICIYIFAICYANEVGEAFRALVPKSIVHLSYGIASAYVLADTADKTLKAQRTNSSGRRIFEAAADTLLWQTFASVIIPGFTINRLCALSLYTLEKTTKLSKITRKWTTTIIGLAAIPFIFQPIDRFVDHGMDKTIRKMYTQE